MLIRWPDIVAVDADPAVHSVGGPAGTAVNTERPGVGGRIMQGPEIDVPAFVAGYIRFTAIKGDF